MDVAWEYDRYVYTYKYIKAIQDNIEINFFDSILIVFIK